MDNIRIEQLLGNKKVIVGTKYNDLVLETLGKVYVKTGNNFKLLTELIGTLNKSNPKNVLIVSNVSEMENMKYPGDGYFVFVRLNKALYISYDNRYIKLIETDEEEKPNYVKKSGDTMTGPLEINTTLAPLIVASSELIKNLNSEQVGGYKAEDLAKLRKDEIIYGFWTFKNSCTSEDLWTFNKNVNVKGDIIIKGSLGSPAFASGFGGYGWRFDAGTNTLTVDYLVVRKAMNVYELIVNQISATNGSLWVSNAITIEEVEKPLIVTVDQLNYFEQDESDLQIGWQNNEFQKDRFNQLFFENKYYVITDEVIGDTLTTNGDIVTESTSLSSSQTINNTPTVFVNYKYLIKIADINGLLESPKFLGKATFLNEEALKELSPFIELIYISKKVQNGIYVDTFDKDCGFFAKVENTKIKIKSYYKYYALKRTIIQEEINKWVEYFNNTHNKTISYTVPSLYIINSKDYSYFKAGDIIRCQKFQNGNVKYYDAVVLSQINNTKIIIQKAASVFDQYTEVEYIDGDKVQYTTQYSDLAYNKGEMGYDVTTDTNSYLEGYETEQQRLEARLAEPEKDDGIVQMGNLQDVNRQNAVYITSTDDQSPFIDIISEVNRPDYSVLYETPKYKRYSYINTTIDNGYRGRKYNYYLLAPTPENSSINNAIPIYKGEELLYYGTLQPLQNSLIEQLNGEDIYEYKSSTKARLGKLDGIVNPILKDKQPYGYGLYGENVFLTGEFYLSNGKSVVDFSKDYIDLQIKSVNDNLLSTGINIQDKTITVTADNFKIQANDGTQIGAFVNDGNNVYFNANLIKADEIIANIGSWNKEIKVGKINNNDYHFTVDSSGNLTIQDSKLSKNFIVTNNGYLTAVGANVTGTINAEDGEIGGFRIDHRNIYAGTADIGNYISLNPDRIYFSSKLGNKLVIATFGAAGTSVAPENDPLFIPMSIYRELRNPNSNPNLQFQENIGLYIECKGGKKANTIDYSGDTAIQIKSGFIRGLRYNVKKAIPQDSGNFYQLTDDDTYVLVTEACNGVYLPNNPQEGQYYIIRKANYHGVIFARTNDCKIVWGETPPGNATTECKIDSWYSIMFVYSNMVQDTATNKGYWWANIVG